MEKRERGGCQDFPLKTFCLTVSKISVGQSFTVTTIPGIEKFWIREGGVARFSAESFLSHSSENFRRAILYCCNSFGIEKVWTRGGGYQNFPWKIFCLIVPKKFVGEPFSVSIISGTEKVWRRERGVVKIFR